MSAILVAASFAPDGNPALAPLAWAPWLAAMTLGAGTRAAATAGALHAAVLHGISCFWMVAVMRTHGGQEWVTALPAFTLVLALMAPYGIIVGLAGETFVRRAGPLGLILVAPMACLLDIVRSRLALGFPWYIPGMTQADSGPFVGLAELGGVHLVSCVVLLVAIAAGLGLVAAIRVVVRMSAAPALRGAALASALALAGLAASHFAQQRHAPGAGVTSWRVLALDGGAEHVEATQPSWTASDAAVRVAIVQGAVPQDVVMTSTREDDEQRARLQLQLSGQALSRGAEVVVWSESAHPNTPANMPWVLRTLEAMLVSDRATGQQPEAIVGLLIDVFPRRGEPADNYTLTNSALLVDGLGPKGRYDKRQLVPLGEYMPAPALLSWFPQLTRVVGDLRRGTSDAPLAGSHARMGTFICYEAVLPQHVRNVAISRSDILVNITNDGWFHGSAVPEEHLRFAVMRAVEHRKWVVRAANSGISAIIAPDGSVVGRLEEGERGLLLAEVERSNELTPYARFGDAPLASAGLVAMSLLGFELILATRRRWRLRRVALSTSAEEPGEATTTS